MIASAHVPFFKNAQIVSSDEIPPPDLLTAPPFSNHASDCVTVRAAAS